MALSIMSADSPRECAPIDWATVQFAQFEHDEKYHREISRLPIQDRLRHMALHFAKYAGRLYEDPADCEFKRTATDTLIIAVSCANTLNIDLSKKAPEGALAGMPRATFSKRLTVAAGRMASACERLDHLEDFPFRAAMVDEVLALLAADLALFNTEGWSPITEMQERLAPVKAKSIFHGKL